MEASEESICLGAGPSGQRGAAQGEPLTALREGSSRAGAPEVQRAGWANAGVAPPKPDLCAEPRSRGVALRCRSGHKAERQCEDSACAVRVAHGRAPRAARVCVTSALWAPCRWRLLSALRGFDHRYGAPRTRCLAPSNAGHACAPGAGKDPRPSLHTHLRSCRALPVSLRPRCDSAAPAPPLPGHRAQSAPPCRKGARWPRLPAPLPEGALQPPASR